ncbi:MAG: ABC transporter permease [Ignavibacteria bacterium]|nr:ABC transporter permease [Ignavibacteria bacterium]MBI3766788.1 ABC transporter permease [Ignavibacteriales bacterium]
MSQPFETIMHEIRESLVMALVALRTNKLRSVLTLLGIAVGVFSIIAVMTAMGVLVNSIENGLSQLGANTFQIQKNPMFNSGDPQERAKVRNRRSLRYPQGLVVKERTTLAKAVGLEAWDFGKIVATPQGQKTNPGVQIAGEDIDGFTTNNWTIGDGRLFMPDEVSSARRVAVLGMGVVEKIFPKSDPIGQTIRVDGQEYQVIGVIERQGGMLGGNNDNFVTIPLPTFFNVYGNEREIHIMVQSTSRDTYEDCIEQVRGILRAARQVPPGSEDDFYIFSNDSLIQQFSEFTKYARLGIMIISAIALIAAGVGIMNIMLVSVTERTREIGIRKAIGARKNNILTQFILEAVVLSELGGIIGIIAGIGAGNLIAIFFEVPPVIPFDWAAIGFIVCSIIGIIFGVYPAWKASNLDPIESLRFE